MPSARQVKVELIRDLAAIDPHGLRTDDQRSMFDRLAWFERTWVHCKSGDTPLAACASSGRQAAWLFLAQRPDKTALALASWYTLAFQPVFAGQPDPSEQHALLAAIARKLSVLGHVCLDHVPTRAASTFASAFTASGWYVIRTPDTAHWTVDVARQSFADYWAARPGQLRSTAKRKAAKAALAITIADRFDEADWRDYADVYNDSWKPEEGSIAFLHDMAQTEGARGALRLGIARKDGVAIAAQLWTVEHGTAIIHKLAHRRRNDACSPGTLLSKAMFEHVIDRDHVASIDFGTGDDRYKADWMTTRTMLERVELYNLRSLRGLSGAAKAIARQLVARVRHR